MRQKKSNMMYYVIAVVVIIAVAFVVMHEVPMQVEHVEKTVTLQ